MLQSTFCAVYDTDFAINAESDIVTDSVTNGASHVAPEVTAQKTSVIVRNIYTTNRKD